MKILGIDPALSSLGWGVLSVYNSKIIYIDSATVTTKSVTPIHNRLWKIVNEIEKVIEIHKPQAISMEETFMNINANSSLKLGYVRGALMSVIGKSHLPFYEYKPNKVKKTIVGVGHADKEQVKHMIKIMISGIKGSISLDESDALAVAYTCLVNATHS